MIDPNGRRARVPLSPFPFRMGRAPDNNLVLRDSRISRNHAQIAQHRRPASFSKISAAGTASGSTASAWKNRGRSKGSERIEFGVPDGYQIHFTRGRRRAAAAPEQARCRAKPGRTGSANLEKLRAVLEVARSLQSSFSTDDVLNTVLDAALAVTGAERGFLLLFDEAARIAGAQRAREGRRRSPAGRTAGSRAG